MEIPDTLGLSFAGQTAQHGPYLYHIVSRLMERPHEKPFGGIIELGTGFGALTTYLGLWGARLGIPVFSFDTDPRSLVSGAGPLFQRLGVIYRKDDVFANSDKIRSLMNFLGRVYLVCDNGNKPLEFQTFVPFVEPGSIVSAHDWGIEIKEADVKKTVEENNMVPVDPELWLAHGAFFASWIKQEK